MRASLICLALAASAVAQEAPQDEDASNEIVVVGVRKAEGDIVVRGAPRCYGRDGDPFDTIRVPHGIGPQSVIGPDATGTVRWHADDEPILGPAIWQRTGNAIGDYRFRVPEDATKPLCIGALPFATQGFGQLRRIVAADGMHGRYLHFSGRVQTRKAGEVRFWLAAGDAHNRRYRGGDTRRQPIRGTSDWQQVDLIVGPVPAYANHVSYGFLLQGRGDAWLADPKLEVLTREQALAVASLPVSRLKN